MAPLGACRSQGIISAKPAQRNPVQPSEPPMGGGSAQPSEMDVDKEGSRGDEKKDKAANEAAVASKSAKPHPAKASRPEALGGSLDVTLISDVRERDRDISDDEFSPTNVCMFPESWEGVMPTSVIDKAGGFEQFRRSGRSGRAAQGVRLG